MMTSVKTAALFMENLSGGIGQPVKEENDSFETLQSSLRVPLVVFFPQNSIK
jgi:hypothetical protein